MAIKKGTLDELLSGRDPKEVFSKDGLFDELKKALAERVLNAELDEHLDGEAAAGKANHRNGYSLSRHSPSRPPPFLGSADRRRLGRPHGPLRVLFRSHASTPPLLEQKGSARISPSRRPAS